MTTYIGQATATTNAEDPMGVQFFVFISSTVAVNINPPTIGPTDFEQIASLWTSHPVPTGEATSTAGEVTHSSAYFTDSPAPPFIYFNRVDENFNEQVPSTPPFGDRPPYGDAVASILITLSETYDAASDAIVGTAHYDITARWDHHNNDGFVGSGVIASFSTDLKLVNANFNHAPVITSNGGGDSAVIPVPERSTVATDVVAVDPDGTGLTYSIVGGIDQARFQIDPASGRLSFLTPPSFNAPTDSDHNNSYFVQVRASDGALSDTQAITVNVTDVNEAIARPSDFNGDFLSDILWQNNNGAAAIWTMNSLIPAGGGVVAPNPGPSWHVGDAADFNGDGKGDIVWQNDGGAAAIWFMNGTTVTGGGFLKVNPGTSWHVRAAADFNGDGKADILWQNDNGAAAIWLMNGTSVIGSAVLPSNPGPSWHIRDAADFSGDGRADILWQNDSGAVAVWLMVGVTQSGSAVLASNPGPSWHALRAADFTGDGRADILWQNDSGVVAIWSMNALTPTGSAVLPSNPGPSWHVRDAGDVNGDGKADILWQNDSGAAAVWLMDGLASTASAVLNSNPGIDWHLI